ncbi:MAG: diguanylate cyclase [Terriglobia bacterium]
MTNTVERSVRIGFILGCVLSVWFGLTAYLNLRHAEDARAWSIHTRTVIDQINAVQSSMQDIETAIRGYLLTGNGTFLEPCQRANAGIATQMAGLKTLTVDNPSQQERVRELQTAVEQKITITTTLITARQKGNYDPAQIQGELELSKDSVDHIRAILASMNQEEEDLRQRRKQAFEDAAAKTVWTLTYLAGLMFFFFTVSYVFLDRHLRGRRRAESALRESEDRVRLLLDSAAEAICGVNRTGLCTFANRATLTTLGYTDSSSFLGQSIHKVAHHSRPDGTPYPVDECPILEVVRTGTPVHGDKESFWRRDGTCFPAEFWSYPIIREGEITGAVVTFVDITSRKRGEQDVRDANLKLSEGIRQLELRNQEIALMSEMVGMLQSCAAPEEAYEIVNRAAGRLFPGTGGALGVISASRDVVEILTEWGDPALNGKVFLPEDCWALRSGRPYLFAAGLSHPPCKHVRPDQGCSTFCVPVMALGESLGVLIMSDPVSEGSLAVTVSSPRQNLAAAFAENVGLALANLQLHETLRIQSIRDPLTTLFNRRYMEEFFEREVKRAARNNRPIGVILCDLDHFKRYNDTFGHEAGDLVLKETAALFCTLIRGDDIACRYGGEEFLIVMPDSNLETTTQRADSLNKAVAHLLIEHRGQSLGAVTLSAGVAAYPEHGQSPISVLRSADQALYRAKEGGRNRVCTADQVLSVQGS